MSFTNPFRQYGIEQGLTINLPQPGAEVPAASLDEVQVNAYDTSDEVPAGPVPDRRRRWRLLEPSGKFTWFAELDRRAPRHG